MKYEKYTDLEVSSDSLEFKFISAGPKGNISKIVQFKETNMPGLYNLAFGNLNMDGTIDDLCVSDNRDRNKVLATVAFVVYEFFRNKPGKIIFFSGSTPERTRLYRMAITINYEELSLDFDIYGIMRNNGTFIDVPFEKNIAYFGFLIKRKSNNFDL